MHSKVHNNDRTTVHSVIFPLQDPSKPFLPNLYFCTEPWLQRTLPASDGLIRLHDSDSFSCRHPSPGQTTVVLRIWAFASHSLCGHRVCKPVFRVRCGNESATVAAGETYTVLPCRCGNSEQRGKDTVWTVHEYDDKVTNPKQKKKKGKRKNIVPSIPSRTKISSIRRILFFFPSSCGWRNDQRIPCCLDNCGLPRVKEGVSVLFPRCQLRQRGTGSTLLILWAFQLGDHLVWDRT